MTFTVWVILIVILLIIGAILTEIWRARQKLQLEHAKAENFMKNSAGQEPSLQSESASSNGTEHSVSANGATRFSEIATRFSEQMSHKIQGFREEKGTLKQPALVTQFRLWVVDAFDEDPKIRQWLSSLSDEQLEAYSSYLADFCRDMGFELSWLLDGRVAQDPQLSSQLEKIILYYSQASYQAVSTQPEVAAFNVLHDYLEDPVCRKNLALSQKVFGRLIEKGLTPINISEHLILSKRGQTEQILQVIQATAAEYPETFKSIVAEAMFEPTVLERDIDKAVTSNISNNGVVEDKSQVLETVPASA